MAKVVLLIKFQLKPFKTKFLKAKKDWESDTRRMMRELEYNNLQEADQNEKLS